MIPLQVIFLPVYQVVSVLGHDEHACWGLIIPPAATPTGVFLLRQYMLSAARRAASRPRASTAPASGGSSLRIVLPLCRPALAVVAIFSVIWRWNDFLWPLIVAQDESVYTLPVALARFTGQLVVPFNLVLAMSVMSILPVVILFLLMQTPDHRRHRADRPEVIPARDDLMPPPAAPSTPRPRRAYVRDWLAGPAWSHPVSTTSTPCSTPTGSPWGARRPLGAHQRARRRAAQGAALRACAPW